MKLKNLLLPMLILGILFIIFSCVSKIAIPGMHITLESLWMKKIERRIIYRPINYKIPKDSLAILVPYIDELVEENLISTKNYIRTSTQYSYKRVPVGKIYFNYSNPFGFHIIIYNLNQEIEKVLLKQLILNTNTETINLLELPEENLSFTYSWWLKDGSSSYGKGIGLKKFTENFEITIEKRENEYVDNIYLNFNYLPINYEIEPELSVFYELGIYFNNGEEKIIKHEIRYERVVEEYLHRDEPLSEQIWHEILFNEWKKYL